LVLVLLGVVLLGVGVAPLLGVLPVLMAGREARGKIAAVEQMADPREYRVWVEFATLAGEPTRAPFGLREGRRRGGRVAVGETVALYYAVGDPQRVALATRHAAWRGSWVWAGLGLFMVWLGAWEIRRTLSRAQPSIGAGKSGRTRRG
jgi:hypothetical protein